METALLREEKRLFRFNVAQGLQDVGLGSMRPASLRCKPPCFLSDLSHLVPPASATHTELLADGSKRTPRSVGILDAATRKSYRRQKCLIDTPFSAIAATRQAVSQLHKLGMVGIVQWKIYFCVLDSSLSVRQKRPQLWQYISSSLLCIEFHTGLDYLRLWLSRRQCKLRIRDEFMDVARNCRHLSAVNMRAPSMVSVPSLTG